MWQAASDELVSSVVHECLENTLEEQGIKDYTVDISAGTIPGDNYLGIIAQTQVRGKDVKGNDITLNLIIKSAPHNEILRKAILLDKLYEREIYVYSKVFPEFQTFQQEKGIKIPLAAFAKYYGSTTVEQHEAIIMENMKELGYKIYNRRVALDYNHIILVMREYGRLHALSFAMKDQNPELFEEIAGHMNDIFFKRENPPEVQANFERQTDKIYQLLDPSIDKEARIKYRHYQCHALGRIYDVVQAETAGKYAVIGHGDCWTNNLLFKYNDSTSQSSPKEVCFLDWQLSRLGSPALDISYFMFTCTNKDFRDKHYNHIIEEYYNSFSLFLTELDSNPEELFPFEVLQEHLKKFSIYGFYMSSMVIHLMSSESEEIPNLADTTNTDEMAEKFNFTSKNENEANEKIRNVIIDFTEYDYEL